MCSVMFMRALSIVDLFAMLQMPTHTEVTAKQRGLLLVGAANDQSLPNLSPM